MSTEINSLTPEQEARIPFYLDKYLKVGLSCDPCDRPKAEEAVARAYDYLKMKRPTFVWAESPFKGAKIAAQLAKGVEDVTQEEEREQMSAASYGSFEAYWVSFYAFVARELPVKSDNLVDIVDDIVHQCGVFWTFEDIVVLTEKPLAIHMVENKLHNPNGLALEYRDGEGIYALDGVRFPSMIQMAVNKMATQPLTEGEFKGAVGLAQIAGGVTPIKPKKRK